MRNLFGSAPANPHRMYLKLQKRRRPARYEDAARDLMKLAVKLGVNVEAMFQDVKLLAVPDGDAEALVKNWRIAHDRDQIHKFARS